MEKTNKSADFMRVQQLQQWLRAEGCDAFLLPITDEYQGEYLAEYACRVPWLTGFESSAGLLAVLPEAAAIFVDGRYTLQASQHFADSFIEVFNSAELPVVKYLLGKLELHAKVLLDPKLHTIRQLENYRKQSSALELEWVMAEQNPVDLLWDNQPEKPLAPVELYALSHAGEGHEHKRQRISAELRDYGEEALLLTQPDAICWLLNIRGNDIPYNPLPLCFALLYGQGTVDLFLAPEKVSGTVRAMLGGGVDYFAESDIASRLEKLKGKKVSVDAEVVSAWWQMQLQEAGVEAVFRASPVTLAKAKKNSVEIEGIKEAHRIDGAAVTSFLYWLDQLETDEVVTELDVVARLEKFRSRSEKYLQPSFATIAGAGPNGAVVHYRATDKTNLALPHNSILLLDSGGQYLQGTTDITRTMARGNPPAGFKEHFTQVLKGHIALAQAVFPKGTSGPQLDTLARMALWQEGLDYDHGTGHGVGCYLCVHEGPQRISKRSSDTPLEPGMVLSNEPGYYRAGEYGIRIENLVLVEERFTGEGGKPFYGFRTLTLVPIDSRLVEPKLLSDSEKVWLNSYNHRVLEELSPYLGEAERQWLAGLPAV